MSFVSLDYSLHHVLELIILKIHLFAQFIDFLVHSIYICLQLINLFLNICLHIIYSFIDLIAYNIDTRF